MPHFQQILNEYMGMAIDRDAMEAYIDRARAARLGNDLPPGVIAIKDPVPWDELIDDDPYAKLRKIERLRDKFDEEMRKRQFIDEETRKPIKDMAGYVHGVVFASDDYVEYGWFKASPKNIMVNLIGQGGRTQSGISRAALPTLIWSNKVGCYISPKDLSPSELLTHKRSYGQGNFPYQFPKHYEAVESFHLFKDAQEVLNEVHYPLADRLKYTFGLEFETSMGYIPQEVCFRDGLIPLRDGSISGIEYSSVVLEGNRGLNLLKQELDTLNTYTKFNKECALHIHMGGYPVNPVAIYALYGLWYAFERDLEGHGYIPRYSFATAQYKANGKDYCKKLTGNHNCFEDYFAEVTGRHYMGSLVQPHPNDVEKRAKWNIKARYYGLNLVNMLCYKGPKTVEFRFLRPTFNYRKITLWLYILNAVLQYAEKLADKWRDKSGCGDNTSGMLSWVVRQEYSGIYDLLSRAYGDDQELLDHLYSELQLLKLSVSLQNSNGDQYGRDTFFEDELFV